VIGLAVVALVLAACSAGALPSDPPVDIEAPTPAPSALPTQGEGGGADPGGGAVIDPAGELVEPQPGQQNVMSVPLEKIEASVDGRVATITLHWSSGVAPCSVLDQVLIDSGDGTLDVTIREGASDPQAICVMMLQAKWTVVELELEPGTWVIRDSEGGAPPIEITVG
jgi:hypothetical protein